MPFLSQPNRTMNKSQLFGVVSIVASAFVVWLYIVTQIQPNRNDILLMGTFFLTLAVWLGSLFAFLLYAYRVKRGNREILYAHIGPSLRQGFIISSTITTLLFLQLIQVLSLWDMILVVSVAILFEIAWRQSAPILRKG